MSISTKTVRGNKYLVFQWYQNGMQRFEYLGRDDSGEAWEKAWKRLKVYHFERLEEFYSRMPEAVRDKLPLYHDLRQQVEERRRLLERIETEQRRPLQIIPVMPSAFEGFGRRPMKAPKRSRKKKVGSAN